MMKMFASLSRKRLSEVPAFVALASIAIAALFDMQQPLQRLTVAVLLAAFAVIVFTHPLWSKGPVRVHIALAADSAIAAVLLSMRPGWNYFPILFFILSPLALIYLPVKTGLTWIGVFTTITGAVYVAVNGVAGLAYLLPYAAGYVFFASFGWLTVESEHNRMRSELLLAELQAAHQQLQQYAAQVEELTIAQERNRIAREMHDTLGHRLTIASVQLEGAQRLIPTNPERAASIIGTVREQVKEGLTELRRTVAMLRASVEEDLPLDKVLARLAEQVQQATALKIHLNLEGCPKHLSLLQRQALFRAAQEAMTNIQRHAQASEAWLQLATQDGMIHLLISDNGVGISPDQPQSGYGLLGLKERATIWGGDFYIDKRPGGGAQVTFIIPLDGGTTSRPAGETDGENYE